MLSIGQLPGTDLPQYRNEAEIAYNCFVLLFRPQIGSANNCRNESNDKLD